MYILLVCAINLVLDSLMCSNIESCITLSTDGSMMLCYCSTSILCSHSCTCEYCLPTTLLVLDQHYFTDMDMRNMLWHLIQRPLSVFHTESPLLYNGKFSHGANLPIYIPYRYAPSVTWCKFLYILYAPSVCKEKNCGKIWIYEIFFILCVTLTNTQSQIAKQVLNDDSA